MMINVSGPSPCCIQCARRRQLAGLVGKKIFRCATTYQTHASKIIRYNTGGFIIHGPQILLYTNFKIVQSILIGRFKIREIKIRALNLRKLHLIFFNNYFWIKIWKSSFLNFKTKRTRARQLVKNNKKFKRSFFGPLFGHLQNR